MVCGFCDVGLHAVICIDVWLAHVLGEGFGRKDAELRLGGAGDERGDKPACLTFWGKDFVGK